MQTEIIRGIGIMLVAVAVFAVMDAAMKQLVQNYPPLQVSCLRGLASIPFFLLAVSWSGRWGDLMPVRWSRHLIRGVLAIAMLWSFVYAVALLPLADAYAIFLSAPLLVTALAAPLLGEHVGWRRWLAIAAGMLGVLVMLRPTTTGLITVGGLAALGSAICYALGVLMIRELSRTDTTLSIGFSFMVVVALVTGTMVLWSEGGWVSIRGSDWPWIVALGVSGSIGQYLIVEAFRRAPASAIAPFEYTALLWGMALDWLLWSTLPTTRMLAGSSIVIASGLYLIYREHRLARGT